LKFTNSKPVHPQKESQHCKLCIPCHITTFTMAYLLSKYPPSTQVIGISFTPIWTHGLGCINFHKQILNTIMWRLLVSKFTQIKQ
jgi:hypothetical protein